MRFQYRDASGMKVVNVPKWAMAIFGILAVALGLTVLVLGAGLLLVLVPVLIVAGLFARWRLRRILRDAEAAARTRQDAAQGVIEVDYKVVEEKRDDPRKERR